MTSREAFDFFIDGPEQARDDILYLLAQTVNLHYEAKRLQAQKMRFDHVDIFNIMLTVKNLIVIEPEVPHSPLGTMAVDLSGLAKAIDRRQITK